VECKITHVTNFGAFAALEEGVEGLIHISELADGPFSHPRNIVTEGEAVTARVISVNSQTRRLALSLRRPREEAASEPEPPVPSEAPPDDGAASSSETVAEG